MSVLDAATNDLAQLINHLDLEATPGSPDAQRSPSYKIGRGNNHPGGSPVRQRVLAMESPVKNSGGGGLRGNVSSITSLRPYAQARGKPSPPAPQTSSAVNM